MSPHRLSAAAVALLGIMTASATPPPRAAALHPPAGAAPLMVFGGRSAAQLARGIGGKLDAALADLASHAGRARTDHALEDLHSLSPAAHFRLSTSGTGPLVAVDAATRGDPQRLKEALVSLGLEHPAVFRNDVGGWLPVSAIETAAARGEVTELRAALWRTRGVVATQGDFVLGTAALRTQHPMLDGSGVTVGILSDSYDCYAVYAANQGTSVNGVPDPPAAGATGYASNGFTADAETDVATGALPANVNVLEEAGGTFGQAGTEGCIPDFGYPLQLPFADEGRAMLQIVHAIAPGASLAFYTATNTEADFANGIQALANAGAKVIADDVGYFDEPFFQDGLLAQAIDTVQASGVVYFSAAGNNSNLAYDNTAPQFTIAGAGQQTGEMLLNFDVTGANPNASALTVATSSFGMVPGELIAVVVEWDQPYLTGAPPGTPGSTSGATSQIDLCVTPAGPGYSVLNLNGTSVTCTGPNALGTDPVQVLIFGVPANSTATTTSVQVNISVGLAGGVKPGHVKVAWEDNGAGSSIVNFPQTSAPTIQGHPNAAGAAAVGAAFFVDTPPCGLVGTAVLEPYSSLGGSPILFQTNGTPVSPPVIRQKPDFVGPDGTNTTFFGFTLQSASITDNSTVAGCANDASLPNYFGTSAATPHAVGLAALMLQANSGLTPTQIVAAMSSTASAMANPQYASGAGFIQAGAAIDAVPAGPPLVSVSPSSITVGQSATVTWDGINATSCTGSGNLNTSATSGSMTVMPATVGSYAYTLSCSNAHNTQGAVQTSAILAVTAAPSSGGGHGGGALGALTLLVLTSLLLARLLFYSASSTSANTKPSRSTTSPTRTAMGAANIGPADTTV